MFPKWFFGDVPEMNLVGPEKTAARVQSRRNGPAPITIKLAASAGDAGRSWL